MGVTLAGFVTLVKRQRDGQTGRRQMVRYKKMERHISSVLNVFCCFITNKQTVNKTKEEGKQKIPFTQTVGLKSTTLLTMLSRQGFALHKMSMCCAEKNDIRTSGVSPFLYSSSFCMHLITVVEE